MEKRMSGERDFCGRIAGYGNPDFQIAVCHHPCEQLQPIAYSTVGMIERRTEQAGLDRILQRLPFLDSIDFILIERASGNEAQLHSSAVSHQHARIIRQEREFYIEDLNSTNGTFVNGVMLAYTQKKKLEPMDRVTFADVEYLFV